MGILSSNDAWMFKTKPLFKFRSIPYLNILKGHLYGFSLSVLIKEFHNFPNLKLVATSGRYSSKYIDDSSLLSSTWFQSVSGMHNAAPMNDGKKQLGFQTAVIKITQYLDVPIIKSTSLSTLGSPNVQCKIWISPLGHVSRDREIFLSLVQDQKSVHYEFRRLAI